MAKIRMFGNVELFAEPIEQLANGDWLMRSLQHGGRVSAGTNVRVKAGEIIDMNAMPETDGMAELTAGMAKERESIPSVESLLKPIQDAAAPVRAQEADTVARERAGPFPQSA